MDSVKTFVDYGMEFVDKHEAALGSQAATMGGVATGFMRALLECDNCGPGVFRIPLAEDWDKLWCKSCDMVWERKQ
jgi:ribosomal protein S27AE